MKYRRQSLPLLLDRISLSPALLLVLTIVTTLHLGGCASTKEAAVPFTPTIIEPSKTVIYVYRESRFVGAVNKAEIFINNQYAGQLINGSYCTFVTDPGPIEIKALEKIPEIMILRSMLSKLAGKQPLFEFTAEPDRDYFLEFNVAGYKVKEVLEDKAVVKMGGLQPAKFSPDQIAIGGDAQE
ncbi:MAG: hypothetical protein B6D78_15750 [gamma proteobacterium symbiont of Ctena orbiculata]|nr:MAG: hypothetical protein DBP02_14765 [gamma proteobacterium symbiont of Ctena orbiculata]PVV16975.1 MAG: hypothetical protein B6D79_17465 [gamma proteobacterium symbiont of Ctena orbiculata]PVV18623.1 MAG: hypothetical protein B6D78_15750 [gamma proteobacterium symbiont of Ctena orbiculata]